jgi:integrase/recombinase XerD
MPYPEDGAPQLRPGAERIPAAPAPRCLPDLPLDELFEDFLAASASLINAVTEAGYRLSWAMFLAWLALDLSAPADGPAEGVAAPAARAKAPVAPVLGSLSKQLFVDYIAYLQRRPRAKGRGTLSSHSVHHYVRVLRTFVRWLAAEGYYPGDPFAGGGRGIMPHLGPRVLRTAQVRDIELLLAGCDAGRPRNRIERALRERDRCIVLLASDTGVRTEEVVRLVIGDVELEDGWLLVRRSKWGRDRRVPVSRETVAALRRYLRRARPVLAARPAAEAGPDEPLVLSASGRSLTGQGLYQAMGRAYRRGGGTGRFGLHRLRHLWGTHAVEQNVPSRISQAIMGHQDAASQRVYQHPSDAAIKREHDRSTPLRSLPAARRRRLA